MTCCETNNCNTGSFTSTARCNKATSMYASSSLFQTISVSGLIIFALKQAVSFY